MSIRNGPGPTHRAAILAALTVVLVFYAWTAATNAHTFPTQMDYEGRDYFNLLTDAFLEGQTALLVEPAPQLLALDNPYDAAKNYLAFRVHDLSLYEGRYYLYWGPTPVLTSFGPVRLLLSRDLSERVAIVGYSFIGLLFSLLLLRWLVHRYLEGTPRWMLWLGGVALATSSAIPFLLRRPTVYEVAISAGFCFLMAAIHLLLTGAVGERTSGRRLAAGSACLALAIGARASLGVAVLLNLGLLVYLLRHRERPRTALARAGTTVALLGPVALAVVLLLVYNKVRFDSFTEFGQRYQLNDVKPYPPGGLAHLAPGLFYYLFAPARLNLNFPFFHLSPPSTYPGTTPSGYSVEPVGGLLSNSPIVLAVAGLPFALRGTVRRARQLVADPSRHPSTRALRRATIRRTRQLVAVLLAVVSLAGATLLTLCLALYGASMRYATDFTTPFLLVGLTTWMLLARSVSPPFRRLVSGGGAVLILYGAAVGIAISFSGTTDGLRVGNPDLFESFERATSPLPTAAVMLYGRPVITEVSDAAGFDASVTDRAPSLEAKPLGVGRGSTIVEIISPDEREAVLRAVVGKVPPAGEAELSLVSSSQSRTTMKSVPSDPELTDLSVRLTRGRTRVELRVQGAPLPPAGEPADSRALVAISDLRIVAPGNR